MGRFHYHREHEHPLGWSVVDSRWGDKIAYGDKNLCAVLSDLLNGKPYSGLLDNFANMIDDWKKAK
jgi:hypothetical protein